MHPSGVNSGDGLGERKYSEVDGDSSGLAAATIVELGECMEAKVDVSLES